MVVQLKLGGAPSYNKPPPPEPQPSQEMFLPPLVLKDGREVWVSIPLPDKLSVKGLIQADHASGSVTGATLPGYAPFIMKNLASGDYGDLQGHPHFVSGEYRKLALKLGPRDSTVHFAIAWSKQQGCHSMEIEANPRKLGPSGVSDLLDAIHMASNGTLNVGAFLATSRVGRLDIAVDLVGVDLLDLVLTAKNEGKRAHYLGSDGTLEAVYVHRKQTPPLQKYDSAGSPLKVKPKPNRLGALIVKAYDRVRERASVLQPPPHGPAPVVRLEVEKRRFGNKPFHPQMMPSLQNAFGGIRVGFAHDHPPCDPWTWLQYLGCRRGSGPEDARRLLGLSKASGLKLENAYLGYPSGLLPAAAVWARWAEGLKSTGVDLLVTAAVTGHPQSPLTASG